MKYFFTSLFLTVIIFASPIYSQISFERWYGGTNNDIGYSVAQTTDGGYIIAGSTSSVGPDDWDVYLIKTDVSGDTLWTKTYGGVDWDYGYSVAQTTDEGYIVTGRTSSYSVSEDVYLIKTDASGNTLWTRTYGGSFNNDWGNSVAQTTDGGYIIAGWTNSYGVGGDVYLIKTNTSGDTLWTKTYGGINIDWGNSVAQTTDGGYIIAGYTYSYGAGNDDVYLIKTNSSGDTLWTRTYGGADQDWGNSVVQTTDGGYIITGDTYSYGAGGGDIYLIKTDALGNSLWTKTYGGTIYDEGNSVAQTTDGGYIIAGQTNSYGAGIDVYLIKTGVSGDTLWTKTYGGTDIDGGYSVAQSADSGYIVAGATASYGAGGDDVYLVKTDANGNVGVEEKENSDFGFRVSKLRVYPNPFTTKTVIEFKSSRVQEFNSQPPNSSTPQLQIYDVTGRMVRNFAISNFKFPICKVMWDGRDNREMRVDSGVYFIRLNGKSVGKVVKVK